MKTVHKQLSRERRHRRIRARISGTTERPRLNVFRSNTALYAQVIDDIKGITLVAGDTRSIDGGTRAVRAESLGKTIAEMATKAGITSVVFDRGGFPYKGVIKTFAESARTNGLTF